jgi:plasmid stability protein
MVAITIRNVSTEVRDQLAARAARSGRSLQEYLVAELAELASRPRPADVLAAARARVTAADRKLDIDEVLAARDADRR